MMKRTWRFLAYGAIGAVLLLAALAAPAAWATPGQSEWLQTIPTRTPTPLPISPTEPPANTAVPPTGAPPTSGPQATQVPAVPGSTPAPAAPAPTSAACPPASALKLVADREAVWPGATVVFTATLDQYDAAAVQGRRARRCACLGPRARGRPERQRHVAGPDSARVRAHARPRRPAAGGLLRTRCGDGSGEGHQRPRERSGGGLPAPDGLAYAWAAPGAAACHWREPAVSVASCSGCGCASLP